MPGPSPRNTVLNQILQLAPMSTSPINAAFGAMKADAAMRGVKPLKGTMSPDIKTLSPKKLVAFDRRPIDATALVTLQKYVAVRARKESRTARSVSRGDRRALGRPTHSAM
jgi:hypothetical protein